MLRNGTLTSYPQINRLIKPNFRMLLHSSPKNKIMKALHQQFSGSLLPNVLLDKVNYECGLLEGQFVTGLESKFHIPTPCEPKPFGNRTESVMNFQEM